MKKFALLLFPLALLAEPQGPAPKTPPASKTAAAPATGPASVPADATEIAPHVWRHTDKAGKTWIYRQTPFGLSRMEERQAAAPSGAVAATAVEVKATEVGDAVRFEKAMPMGNRIWTVKKADLSADEKAWFEKSQSAAMREKMAEK